MIEWNKQFAVAFVTRNDLVKAGIPKALVENLDDEAMGSIAIALGRIYGDHDYWQNFAESIEGILMLGLTVKREGDDD